jgi:hypothetical protein
VALINYHEKIHMAVMYLKGIFGVYNQQYNRMILFYRRNIVVYRYIGKRSDMEVNEDEEC